MGYGEIPLSHRADPNLCPRYTMTVNRHDGPHNYVRIDRPSGTPVIAVTDRGIEVAEDLSFEESRMVIRVLAEHCRSLYMIQEGR